MEFMAEMDDSDQEESTASCQQDPEEAVEREKKP